MWPDFASGFFPTRRLGSSDYVGGREVYCGKLYEIYGPFVKSCYALERVTGKDS